MNIFAIESAMDDLAAIAGQDALSFRVAHLDDERARQVIQRAGEIAGWPGVAPGEGRALGLGFGRYKNKAAYCAVIAEVECDDRVRVPRVWAVVDAGLSINPDGVANQIEGGIVQAISWATVEELAFDRDGVASRDWEQYPILKFADAPEIVIDVIQRPHEPALGVGEASQGAATAAVANGLARALGQRFFDLPYRRDRILGSVN
jgi:nicotinate dehydrogenase subunit B